MPPGFGFNGRHCSKFGLIMKSKKRRMLSDTGDSYIQVPGKDGSYLFPGKLQDKEIEIECAFIASSLFNLREREREIAAWLHTRDRKILSFDDEPGKYSWAKLTGAVDPEQLSLMNRFSLVFRCEPLACSGEQNIDFVADAVTLNNQGTYATLPRFAATFTDTAAEWKVTNQDGYVRIVHDFEAEDRLEVNFATGAILINGIRAMDKLDWQNSQFFPLRVGENTLGVAPAGVCTTRVYWVPRYL